MAKFYKLSSEDIELVTSANDSVYLPPAVVPDDFNPTQKLAIIRKCKASGFTPGAKVVRIYHQNNVTPDRIGTILRYTLDKFPTWETYWRPLVVEFPPFREDMGKCIYTYNMDDFVLLSSPDLLPLKRSTNENHETH